MLKENEFKYNAGIVGVGSMGSALLSRFASMGEDVLGINRVSGNYLECQLLLLCMKQGDILSWLDDHSGDLSDQQLLISFGAALNLKALRNHCANQRIIVARAMTNRGIAYSPQDIVYTSEKTLIELNRNKVDHLLGKIGNVKYVGVSKDSIVDRETHKACDMGRIAFVFQCYQETLTQGLNYSKSEAIHSTKQSLRAILDALESGEDLGGIAQRVASPGGITEASIITMSVGISQLLIGGMKAASDKMTEIGSRYK